VTLTQNGITQSTPEPITCSLTGGALILFGLLKRRSLKA